MAKRVKTTMSKEEADDSVVIGIVVGYGDNNKPKDLSYGKKPPLSLVPPSAIIYAAKALEDGAKKRSPYNWRQSKISIMQTLDKTLRHLYKYLDGQDIDEESKLPELSHAIADLCVLIDAVETISVIDDRPSKGVATILLDQFSEKK